MKTTTAPPTTDLPVYHPLSDRGRVWKILFLSGLLLAGGWNLSWRLDRAHVDVAEMMMEPAAHQGDTVLLAAFKVVSIEGERAELWSPWAEVEAGPIPGDLELGQPISVVGTFTGTRSVEATRWKIHRRMKIKKAIGVVALALVLGLITFDLLAWRRERA